MIKMIYVINSLGLWLENTIRHKCHSAQLKNSASKLNSKISLVFIQECNIEVSGLWLSVSFLLLFLLYFTRCCTTQSIIMHSYEKSKRCLKLCHRCALSFSLAKMAVRLQVQGVVLLSVGSRFCIGVEKYYRADIFSFLFIVEKMAL